MSAYVKELKDIDDNRIYPVTVGQAVYMPNGKTRMLDEINDIKGTSYTTEFLSNGSIVKTFGSGRVSTITFGNKVITETCVEADGSAYYTKNTTFNNDGSIDVSVSYAGEE